MLNQPKYNIGDEVVVPSGKTGKVEWINTSYSYGIFVSSNGKGYTDTFSENKLTSYEKLELKFKFEVGDFVEFTEYSGKVIGGQIKAIVLGEKNKVIEYLVKNDYYHGQDAHVDENELRLKGHKC